jgi:hypothetical protein
VIVVAVLAVLLAANGGKPPVERSCLKSSRVKEGEHYTDGVVTQPTTVNVMVPPGVIEGQTLQVHGRGGGLMLSVVVPKGVVGGAFPVTTPDSSAMHDVEACCELCATHPECAAWSWWKGGTFSKAVCSLHSDTAAPASPYSGYTSAAKRKEVASLHTARVAAYEGVWATIRAAMGFGIEAGNVAGKAGEVVRQVANEVGGIVIDAAAPLADVAADTGGAVGSGLLAMVIWPFRTAWWIATWPFRWLFSWLVVLVPLYFAARFTQCGPNYDVTDDLAVAKAWFGIPKDAWIIMALVQWCFGSGTTHARSGGSGGKKQTSRQMPITRPRRRSQDMIKAPSYWSMNTLDHAARPRDVTAEWKKRMQDLVDATCNSKELGKGRDSQNHGLTYTRLVVQKVTRVESPTPWRMYAAKREAMRNDLLRVRVPTIDTFCDRHAPSALRAECDSTVNEKYMWHGTKPALDDGTDLIEIIQKNGFDEHVGALGGFFGAGVYFAEDCSKSDQYCTPDSKGHYFLFLSRVMLGVPHNTDVAMNGIRRPPVMDNRKWTVAPGRTYDSVLADMRPRDPNFRFREFIIYKGSQAYPEYLIEYTRQ